MKLFNYFVLILLFLTFSQTSFSVDADAPDIQMNADKVDFDYESNISNFAGNVNIQYKDFSLKSDQAQISVVKKYGSAKGRVMILNGNSVFFCDAIEYDFNEKKGLMINGISVQDVWVIYGQDVRQTKKDDVEITNGKVMICQDPAPIYYITAKKINVTPGKYIIARNVVFWLGPVPLFYLPYYKRSLNDEYFFGLRFRHNDIFGFQAFTRYNVFSSDHTKTKVNLDWYEKRGIGVGLEEKVFYNQGDGHLFTYYIKDDEFEPNRSLEKAGPLERYTVSMTHNHTFKSKKARSALDLNLQSDIDFYDDFYSRDFDERIQLDNRYKLSYSDENYSTGFLTRVKLNDFDNVLERLPQLYYDWHEYQLGESDFYFSSSNHAVYLNQDFNKQYTEKEFNSLRFYTGNTLSYSKKYFGWLTFNPSFNVQALYYSDSLESRQVLDESSKVGTNTLNETTTTTTIAEPVYKTVYYEGDGVARAATAMNVSFSTNLFKVINSTNQILGYEKFRHVITPAFTYSYRPDPTKDNDEIIQFDEYDNIGDESSYLTLDLISRWQAKNGNNVNTILNTRYSIGYDLKADEDPFGFLVYDTQIRIIEDVKTDIRFDYNIEENELDNARLDLSYRFRNNLGFAIAYIYRNYDDDIITPEVSINLGNNFFVRTYGYYNDELQKFERKEIALVKSIYSFDFALKYSVREFRDEETIYFSVTPKAVATRGVRFGNDMLL